MTDWTSVLPSEPGYYWYRTPGPDEDSLKPDTWTIVRLKFWNRPELIGALGLSIQFWPVPVEPPFTDPLAELEALGGYVGCTNDAEEIWVNLGHDYKCIYERCGTDHSQTTVAELRAAAARLVARVRGQVKK